MWFLLFSCGPVVEGGPPLEVTVSPAEPVQGRDPLVCDANAASVQWLVDGVAVDGEGPLGRQVSAERTRLGREWTCRASTGAVQAEATVTAEPLGSNVLLFLLDDIGVDKVGAYGMLDDAPPQTPVIDGLAETGIRFHRAWSTPVCSPTRATVMTGRYGRRTGLGRIIDQEAPAAILAYDEIMVPEMLAWADLPYATAMTGKWHLAWLLPRYLDHPSAGGGFEYHTGSLENLGRSIQNPEFPRGYRYWENNRNGSLSWSTEYATAYTVDQSIALTENMPEPWFLYVPFNGAHIPYHDPPEDWVYTPAADTTGPERFRAMVESIDLAIGRVLDGMDPDVRARTTVFVVGDNGTATASTLPQLELAKGTVLEAGVRVPFIVNGAGVQEPGVSDVLVNTVDLFDTIAAIAGADLSRMDAEPGALPRDSQSFLPVLGALDAPGRTVGYAEAFEPNGPGPYTQSFRAVTDGRFKLIEFEGVEAGAVLFDLENDPTESDDLLAAGPTGDAAEALERLEAAMDGYVEDLVYDAPFPE
ncbi:MAG: sulfatase-like hydrolase/transferase [Myxococcota bacterium]